jgi:hypothetical protein
MMKLKVRGVMCDEGGRMVGNLFDECTPPCLCFFSFGRTRKASTPLAWVYLFIHREQAVYFFCLSVRCFGSPMLLVLPVWH